MKQALVIVPLLAALSLGAGCRTVNKHVSKGFDYFQQLNYKEAEVEFLKAIEDDKDDPYAQLNLGALYQATGRPQKAIELYLKVLETGKNIRPNRKTTTLTREGQTAESNPTLAEMAQKNLDSLMRAAQAGIKK